VKIRHDTWNRAGFCAAPDLCRVHHLPHTRAGAIQKFAELLSLAGGIDWRLPLPPSLWRWGRTGSHGSRVYELRMTCRQARKRRELLTLEHRYFPDAPPNSYIEVAKRLPEVQKVLWFSRFPVTRFHQEGTSLSWKSPTPLCQMRRDRPAAFTYPRALQPSRKCALARMGYELGPAFCRLIISCGKVNYRKVYCLRDE